MSADELRFGMTAQTTLLLPSIAPIVGGTEGQIASYLSIYYIGTDDKVCSTLLIAGELVVMMWMIIEEARLCVSLLVRHFSGRTSSSCPTLSGLLLL